jgi:hypothetical protein
MKKVVKNRLQIKIENQEEVLKQLQDENLKLKSEISSLQTELEKYQTFQVEYKDAETFCNLVNTDCCDCLLKAYIENYKCEKCQVFSQGFQKIKEQIKTNQNSIIVLKEHYDALNAEIIVRDESIMSLSKKNLLLESSIQDLKFENNYIKQEKGIPHNLNQETQTLVNKDHFELMYATYQRKNLFKR